jgi:hypothetical protein
MALSFDPGQTTEPMPAERGEEVIRDCIHE